MSAKEMFEKLGWKYLEDYKYCLFRYKNENENPYAFIYFYGDKTIEIRSDYSQSYKVLQAINKQVEELGWNER